MDNPLNPKPKVLIVSSDSSLNVSRMWLEDIGGLEAISVRLASEALVLAESEMPDAIILAIEIVDMNGFDLCRVIKRSNWGKFISVYAWTGYPLSYISDRAYVAGFDGIFDKSDLRGIVSRIRERKAMRQMPP